MTGGLLDQQALCFWRLGAPEGIPQMHQAYWTHEFDGSFSHGTLLSHASVGI